MLTSYGPWLCLPVCQINNSKILKVPLNLEDGNRFNRNEVKTQITSTCGFEALGKVRVEDLAG